MKIEYRIEFLDYWHLSSGLSAGAKLDNMVVKDENKLPYMPGKTIKGLVREMAEYFEDSDFVNICFGVSDNEEKNIEGECYFSNAIIKKDIADNIIRYNLQDNLYEILTFTSIDEKTKIAEDYSLREIEVVVPITLYGIIDNVSKEYKDKLKSSLEMIKRVGLNRNRGLGRCHIVVEELL